MTEIDKRIIEFIGEHHVLTLATTVNNIPWCSSCFYVYLQEENMFVVTSDDKTRHVSEVRENPNTAANIVLETSAVGKIQGIQLSGKMYEPEGDLMKKAKKAYMKKYPFARLMDTQLWIIDVDYMKMTHNRLGFGKKLIWEKTEI